MEYKEYRKTATVQAKLFELGDEDGFTWTSKELSEGLENIRFNIEHPKPKIPYISTLENQKHKGEFGKHYVCVGIQGERWLVDKDIFESTYEIIQYIYNLDNQRISIL